MHIYTTSAYISVWNLRLIDSVCIKQNKFPLEKNVIFGILSLKSLNLANEHRWCLYSLKEVSIEILYTLLPFRHKPKPLEAVNWFLDAQVIFRDL